MGPGIARQTRPPIRSPALTGSVRRALTGPAGHRRGRLEAATFTAAASNSWTVNSWEDGRCRHVTAGLPSTNNTLASATEQSAPVGADTSGARRREARRTLKTTVTASPRALGPQA